MDHAHAADRRRGRRGGGAGGRGRDGLRRHRARSRHPDLDALVNGEDGPFTKPAVADYTDYLKAACADEIAAAKSCTTIHYKSATRAHIETVGYDIVADFGDQFSDLVGGSTDGTFKLPNPNYFLP